MRLCRIADCANSGVADNADHNGTLRAVASEHEALADSGSVRPEPACETLGHHHRSRGIAQVGGGEHAPSQTLMPSVSKYVVSTALLVTRIGESTESEAQSDSGGISGNDEARAAIRTPGRARNRLSALAYTF